MINSFNVGLKGGGRTRPLIIQPIGVNMRIDFNYKIIVDIWSDISSEQLELIPDNLSEELKEALKKEIISNANKADLIHTDLIDTKF